MVQVMVHNGTVDFKTSPSSFFSLSPFIILYNSALILPAWEVCLHCSWCVLINFAHPTQTVQFIKTFILAVRISWVSLSEPEGQNSKQNDLSYRRHHFGGSSKVYVCLTITYQEQLSSNHIDSKDQQWMRSSLIRHLTRVHTRSMCPFDL